MDGINPAGPSSMKIINSSMNYTENSTGQTANSSDVDAVMDYYIQIDISGLNETEKEQIKTIVGDPTAIISIVFEHPGDNTKYLEYGTHPKITLDGDILTIQGNESTYVSSDTIGKPIKIVSCEFIADGTTFTANV